MGGEIIPEGMGLFPLNLKKESYVDLHFPTLFPGLLLLHSILLSSVMSNLNLGRGHVAILMLENKSR